MTTPKNEFTELEKKLLTLQSTFNFIVYINNQDSNYFKTVVESSTFLFMSYFHAIKLLIIDICNVLNHKENNNLVSYINDNLNSFHNISWHHEIEKKELREIKKELQLIVKGDLYNRIKVLRNKFYVHDDPNKIEYNIFLNIDELANLISGLYSIYNEINFKLNNETIEFKFIHHFSELQRLKKYDDIRNLLYECLKENKSSVELNKLMNIIRGQNSIEHPA